MPRRGRKASPSPSAAARSTRDADSRPATTPPEAPDLSIATTPPSSTVHATRAPPSSESGSVANGASVSSSSASSSPAPTGGPGEHAAIVRVQAIFRKIVAAIQSQRDLRVDLAGARARGVLLDSEYDVLYCDYQRSLAAHNRLEALSKELGRRGRAIDSEKEAQADAERRLREETCHRFNHEIRDIHSRLAAHNTHRKQRQAYVASLQQRVADLKERYDMREKHFDSQVHRKKLEIRLAEARRAEQGDAAAAEQLERLREEADALQREYDSAVHDIDVKSKQIKEFEAFLKDTHERFEKQKNAIEKKRENVRQLQEANNKLKVSNESNQIHIKAMGAECARLEKSIEQCQALEQRERNKVDTLESLCRKVTGERSELNSEIIVMQEAWTKLKQEIDSLKDQVGDTSKIFDVLQSIMNRESLDVAMSTILKSGKSVQDVINEEISNLRLTAGLKLNTTGSKRDPSSSSTSSSTTSPSSTPTTKHDSRTAAGTANRSTETPG